MLGMQQSIDIPASHESILRRNCDNSGHLVCILTICNEPSNWFGMIPSDIFNRHCVFSVEIFAI